MYANANGFFTNLGNYFSQESTIEKLFQGGLNVGVGELQTQQQIKAAQAETERLKAEAELLAAKENADQNKPNYTAYWVGGSIIIIGTAVYLLTRKK
jgi:hypothetical protein